MPWLDATTDANPQGTLHEGQGSWGIVLGLTSNPCSIAWNRRGHPYLTCTFKVFVKRYLEYMTLVWFKSGRDVACYTGAPETLATEQRNT